MTGSSELISKAWANAFSEVYHAWTREVAVARPAGNKIVAKVDYFEGLTGMRRARNSTKRKIDKSYNEPGAKRPTR